jgi:transposase
MDMSPAFMAGTAAHLPQAAITFDRFHIVKILNAAVDTMRRDEQKSRPALKRSRYLWLKNETSLSSSQRERRDSLAKSHLKTARAWQIRLTFQEFYQQPSREAAEAFLKRWYVWVPTAACRRSSRPPARSSGTGTASSRASTAWSRQPKARPGATAPPVTSRR